MTRDEIIRMAREVGFVAYGEDAGEYRIPTPAFHCRLERFADLVSAAGRESRRAAQLENVELKERLARAGIEQRRAVSKEREECAKVCEEQIDRWTDDRARYCASECAAAIRARSQE